MKSPFVNFDPSIYAVPNPNFPGLFNSFNLFSE